MEDIKTVEEPIDAVFVIGTGSKNGNEELRYALRCLDKRCPFVRDVYISGECPEWVDTSVVKHIKWPDRFSHAKDANIIDKLRRACEQEGIASRVLFCSDDQFVTRVCSWEDFSPMWLRRYSPDDKWYENKKRVWHTRLRKTLQREYDRRVSENIPTDGVCYFQPHMWMQIDRDKFVEYAKWSEYERRDDTIIASGYFNFAGERGKENNDHEFLSSNHHGGIGVTHVAYTDSSFGAAMEYLKSEFPEMSRYERSVGKAEAMKAEVAKEEPPKQEKSDKADKSDKTSIEKFVDALGKRAIWSPLVEQVRIVEGMRDDSLPGWKEILNDLIVRWAATTAKGEKVVPVDLKERDPMITLATTSYASGAARVFLEKVGKKIEANHANRSNVANSIPQLVKATEAAGQKSASPVTTKTTVIPAKSMPHKSEQTVTRTVEVKKCSKCEEKRRKRLEEEQARKEREQKEKEVRESVSTQDAVKGVFDGLPPVSPSTIPSEPAVTVEEDGCVECVLEHLGVAVAYLGSNGGYPTLAETALAKGEFTVATRLILALKREALYNRCVGVMASWSTDESLLSAGEVSSILREAANLA